MIRLASLESAHLPARPLHLAIGMFDGVHLGHRSVIEAAVQSARRSGGLAGVLTFRPHPSVLFRPENPTRLILGAEEQADIFARLGVDVAVTQPFTMEFARIEARAFLAWLSKRLPALAAVYVGQGWRFGAGRRGDVALLVETGRKLGLSVFSAPPVNFDGEPVTSTRIRGLLEAGEMAAANALLGTSYFAEGRVAPGRRLGRTIGFPTLNLPWSPDLRPKFGVYAVRVGALLPDNTQPPPTLPGVANYGLRPTVGASADPLLEVHALAPCAFGEGDRIRVDWLAFLRPEAKFESVDALRAQIAKDAERARTLLDQP